MKNCNLVIVSGIVARDVELKTGAYGAFGSVLITITEVSKAKDGWKEEKCYIEALIKGKMADKITAMRLKKGHEIIVKGKLKLETWEKDGVKQSRHKIVADDVWDVSGRLDFNDE